MKKIDTRVKTTHMDRSLLLLIMPAVIWFLAFCYMPMFGIIMAFKRYRLIPGKGFFYSLFYASKSTGLDNFRFLLLNPEMAGIVRNTHYHSYFDYLSFLSKVLYKRTDCRGSKRIVIFK